MGHQHDLLADMDAGQFIHGVADTVPQLSQRFAAGRRPMGVALAPAQGMLGPVGLHVGMGLALKLAKTPLAQAGVCRQASSAGLGNRLRRVPSPGQVTGIDGVQRLATQRLCHLRRLPAAPSVEPDVQLTLDARGHIPGGLAVANGNDAGGLHGGSRGRGGWGQGLRH